MSTNNNVNADMSFMTHSALCAWSATARARMLAFIALGFCHSEAYYLTLGHYPILLGPKHTQGLWNWESLK